MRNFKTADGRTYKIRLDRREVDRIASKTGLRLTDLLTNPIPIRAALSDEIRLTDLMLEVVGGQLKKAGRTPEQFCEAVDLAVMKRFADAVIDEVVDLCPEPKRSQIRKMVASKRAAEADRDARATKIMEEGGTVADVVRTGYPVPKPIREWSGV